MSYTKLGLAQAVREEIVKPNAWRRGAPGTNNGPKCFIGWLSYLEAGEADAWGPSTPVGVALAEELTHAYTPWLFGVTTMSVVGVNDSPDQGYGLPGICNLLDAYIADEIAKLQTTPPDPEPAPEPDDGDDDEADGNGGDADGADATPTAIRELVFA